MYFFNVIKFILRFRRLIGLTFIDLDNTILPFNEERWQKKAYPLPELDKPWVSSLPSDAIIISKYKSWKEKRMKKKWLRHYFPRNMYILTRISKEKVVPVTNNFLISDWHKELFSWQNAGGIPIQLSNGTNHKHFEKFLHWYEDEEDVHLLDEDNYPLILLYRKEVNR